MCGYDDCLKVFCEHPKSLKARVQTWSNYKNYNTVKFLIAIPKGWGGHMNSNTR